jgi:hypothetical protein
LLRYGADQNPKTKEWVYSQEAEELTNCFENTNKEEENWQATVM